MVHKSKHSLTRVHSLSGGLRKIILGGLAFLAVALLVVTVFDTRNDSRVLDANEPPPSLQVAGGAKGSFVDPVQGYIQYQANDRQVFLNSLPSIKVKNPTSVVIPAGTNYLFTDKETTMGEIFRGIDPVANRLILAYYSSGEFGRAQGFYTYAKGPFTDTYEIKAQDLNSFVIPANRGVVVMTEKDTVSYGLTPPVQMTPTALSVAANSAPMDAKLGGWVLLPSNTSRISDMIALYKDRVVSAWALTSRNTFERIENRDAFALTRYFLVWLKLAPAQEVVVAPKEKMLIEYVRNGVTTNQWFEGSLISEVNGSYTVELNGQLVNTVNDPTFSLSLSDNKLRLFGKKNNVASVINPRAGDLEVNQLVVAKSPKTGRYWNAKILAKKADGTFTIGYKDENYANPVNVSVRDINVSLVGKVVETASTTVVAGAEAVAATPTHTENLATLSKYLKWERVAGTEKQDANTGDLYVSYRVYVDNFRTITDKNLRIEVLKNPHWGDKAWQIVHEGPYNIQVLNGNITFAQNMLSAGSSTFADQRDGSLAVKVRIPFPGIPLPSDTSEWGKVDVDFAFSDAANAPVVITSKYVTEQIARPSPIVSAGDGEVIFTNNGPGMIPADYLKRIVFYSSGGENATSLYNIFQDKGTWWSGSKSNWYNLDVGSKNWLLYDKDAHNYDADTKGHIGLPTIYSASVASKDQDWKW